MRALGAGLAMVATLLAASTEDVRAQAPPSAPGQSMQRLDWSPTAHGGTLPPLRPDTTDKLKGLVVIRCHATKQGTVADCVVLGEDPAGGGFGAAALRIATQFRMARTRPDGRSVAGTSVDIPIRFDLKPSSADQ